MNIVIRDGRIDVLARVSTEEALVAEALATKTDDNTTPEDIWRRHGSYLLLHVKVTADGTPLKGRVTSFKPPSQTNPTGLIQYDLQFDTSQQPPPHMITVQQNVLNEFLYGPGNRWEATYIVSISQRERVVRDALLFSSRERLRFTCNWSRSESQSGAAVNRQSMIGAFIRHGVAHILSGYDHLLFIAGLVIAVASLWDLLKVVTAFTIAHTITLTLAVLDIVRVPNRIVEPMIAASIVFVAVQNLITPARTRGWARLSIAFGFGLFHGLGFAGGLLSAMETMSSATVLAAIAAFSVGVEIGHQFVALPLFAAMKIIRSYKWNHDDPELVPRWTLRAGSTAICCAGMVYLIAALR